MELPQSYDDEPEEIFEPLTEELYSRFYQLETADVTSDMQLWDRVLPAGRILEMGCGCGRLTTALARSDRQLVGIDLSPFMLRRAKEACIPLPVTIRPLLAQMDMTRPAFPPATFDAVLIAWNTLNLLPDEAVTTSLAACASLLRPDGLLALQLHLADAEFRAGTGRTFQFQLFPLPEAEGSKGRLIREILRRFDPQSGRIEMEERWRLRPMTPGCTNRNWSITRSLCGWPEEQWRTQFAACGFTVKREWKEDGWCLLLERSRQEAWKPKQP